MTLTKAQVVESIQNQTGFPKNKSSEIVETLIDCAKKVAENAKVHLSNFRVGAAILTEDGAIHSGCNIEFDNYSNTIHAEESAISSLISSGNKSKLICIAVYTFGDEPFFPCGMCRQSLFELGGNELKVISCNQSTFTINKMGELLPSGFHL